MENDKPKQNIIMAQGGFLPVPRMNPAGGLTKNESQTLLTMNGKKTDRFDMELARAYWLNDPLVYKCISTLVQLANSEISFDSEDDPTQNLIENWFKKVMPASFIKQWFLEYFRSGMVVSVKTLIPYAPRDYKQGKVPQTNDGNVEVLQVERVKATAILVEKQTKDQENVDSALVEYQEALASEAPEPVVAEALRKLNSAQTIWTRNFIPGAYTLFDPLRVDIEGPESMSWLREPYLQINPDIVDAVKNPTPDQAELLNKLPLEIIRQVKSGTDKVRLSPNICNITYGDKQPYEVYPTPMTKHCFDALAIKHKLQKMDEATSDQIKERILLVKLGNDEFPMTDELQVKHAFELFASRRSGNSNSDMYFFWNHLIEMQWVEPNSQSLSDSKKFEHWNDEIRTCFGVSKVLTGNDGRAGSQGSNIINLKGVVEQVSEAQNLFLEFLNQEIELLRSSIGIAKDVKVKFQQLNLRDENEYAAIIMQLIQNGVLDLRTGVETLGYDFPTIRTRMEETKELRKDELFMPSPSANNMGPEGGISTPGGGKPRGKTGKSADNSSQKGKTKPKLKIAARLAQSPEGELQLVTDSSMSEEDVRAVASTLGMDANQIIDVKDFEKATGQKVSFTHALPELESFEIMEAMESGSKMYDQWQKALSSTIKQSTSSRSEDGKGKYATKQVKKKAIEKVIASAYSDGFEEFAAESNKRDMSLSSVANLALKDTESLKRLACTKAIHTLKLNKSKANLV